MTGAQHGGGVVTLLFTDLVSSTELAQRLGEDAAEEFRRLHFGLLRGPVGAHGGTEVKNLGDGLMVAFGSAVDALRAAVAMQRAVAAHNASGAGPAFAVRIGLHAGEPIRDGDDYFGTPVIVAKRLCDRAEAGQILAGELLADLVGTRGGFVLRRLGALELKGLLEPVPAVEVDWDPDAVPFPRLRGRPGEIVRPPGLAPPPDAFVGRETELATLTRLLQDTRLVTIIGPGGVGKTRLSAHLVDAVAGSYPDGVWCCALASVLDDEQVPGAVATTLRVEGRAGVGLADRVVEFLTTKRALLVLDNCEQIVDGAAGISAAVLAGTAGVDVLATSREALGVAGEHRVSLGPLSLGPAGGGARGAAVTLFLERAAAGGRQLGDADLPAVDELCRRVDGLPLAIELAAAKVASRTVPEIVADVTERLADLSVRRGKPERHRSIHALVDWSYDLLDDADRRLFERMAVFAGGADAEAVAAVLGGDRGAVLDRVQALADQSLVSTRPDVGTTRYALLEPVRAYAEQRLRQRGDLDAARGAHARHFVDLAERATVGLRSPDESAWTARLDSELANLRSAHRWLLHQPSGDGALRLAAGLFWYITNSGTSEVPGWAAQAAERFAATGHPLLPIAWASAGWGTWISGDLQRASDMAERSIAAAGADTQAARHGIFMRAVVAGFSGDLGGAAVGYLTAAELSEAAADHLLLVTAIGCRAITLGYAGATADAAELGDSAIELATAGGVPSMLGWAYYCAGEARLEADPGAAAELLARSLAAAAGPGNRFILGAAGLSALSLRARLGDPAAALPCYPDLIDHWQRSGAWAQQWLTLRTLIETLTGSGHAGPAAVLYGAMATSTNATPLIGTDAVRLGAVLERLRQNLGDADLKHHQEQGARLGDSGAVAYAREVLREILEPGPDAGLPRKPA